MPIYEYKCDKCGKCFEHLAKSFSEKEPSCPFCGASKTTKQISTFTPSTNSKNAKKCGDGSCPASGSQCASSACKFTGCCG